MTTQTDFSTNPRTQPSFKSSTFLKREETLGKPVVGTDGVIVGTVKDLAVSQDGRGALQVERKNPSDGDLFVGSNEIQAVADVVLLKYPSGRAGLGEAEKLVSEEPVAPNPPPVSGLQQRICPKCGYANLGNSRFCIKCGSSLS